MVKCTTVLLVTLLILVSTVLHSMDLSRGSSRQMVYARQYGECFWENDWPAFPAGAFYTKPAVHILVNYLKDKVVRGCSTIDLKARLDGAGVAINCLYYLIHYDPCYFENTSIQSKEDAKAIADAINRGSIEFTVPMLSLEKTKSATLCSKTLGYITIVGICFLLYRNQLFSSAVKLITVKIPTIAQVRIGGIVFTALACYLCGTTAKNFYAPIIDRTIVPYITSYCYDPFHIKPIDAVKSLRGHIKCPVLIHCEKNNPDSLLENPDEDTVVMYDAFRDGNEDNTYIIVTSNVREFDYYKAFANNFDLMAYGLQERLKDNKPTLEQLRKKL